ncbi:riboflavin biosynthesis protein RibD [candidate division WOR-3 bacterium JGI_Cruoil_03_44_89]|uniref:Riboflavin biosynthesis protein RibD n=1 Tax=candidate division WOR-3 bacterium JGI_Cruoil_03_44_89 TaxID=1973748 RepID=A0A235BRJ3_UNCW3|nr:MAG: riboflavin biosynthesis protein RibD [candidate division WOR-3 bacterium JGI_Cruoil_03_44_89]
MEPIQYMRYALTLAKKGRGTTSPNPMVGAVLLKDGKIVGRGFHSRKGEPHAEHMAIKEAGSMARNATLFVSLEPCVHFGATPPCVDTIIREGIRKVFIATPDPNPIVNGRGIKKLSEAGVDVEVGLCEREAIELNEIYNKFITTKEPFVILKAAITLDGKIATGTCQSKWITGEEGRRFVHRLRASVDAVLVGINTIFVDDPLLTTRLTRGKSPKRIVLDSDFRIPGDARVLGEGCIVATTSSQKRRINAEVWQLDGDEMNRVDIGALLREAGRRNITSILVEGGRDVYTSFLKKRLVDKFYVFIGAKIFGESGIPSVGDLGIRSLEDALDVKYTRVKKVGGDVLITGYPHF